MATGSKGVHDKFLQLCQSTLLWMDFFVMFSWEKKNMKLKFPEISNTTKNLINIKVMALKYTFLVQNRLKLKLSSLSVKERVQLYKSTVYKTGVLGIGLHMCVYAPNLACVIFQMHFTFCYLIARSLCSSAAARWKVKWLYSFK